MIWDTRCIKKGLLFWPPMLNNGAVKMFSKAHQNVFIHHRWFLQASKTDQWCPYETWKIYTSNKEETWDGAPCGESFDLTLMWVLGYVIAIIFSENTLKFRFFIKHNTTEVPFLLILRFYVFRTPSRVWQWFCFATRTSSSPREQ